MGAIRGRDVGADRSGRWRLLGVPAAAAAASFTLLAGPASAATTDPYPSASTGYDVSYPNCSATPPAGSFAIVGLGGGRPFTLNSCAGGEWATASSVTGQLPSLYFNTGYAGAYSRNIDTTCQNELPGAAQAFPTVFQGLSRHSLSQAQQAWEIGCSEADYARLHQPAGSPTMWWADIETGNSWSTNSRLNDYTVDGMSYQMTQVMGGGGFYSSPSMWASITGSQTFQPTPAPTANWVTGGSCATFGGSTPTWLTQGGTVGGVDTDTAC